MWSQRNVGRRAAQGCAASKAAAACSTPRSSKRRPTTCNPTGSPSAVKPQGTLAAGFQDILKGWENSAQLTQSHSCEGQWAGISSSAGKATTETDGVSKKSQFSNQW